ncbi:nuclear transport factor 2 family protein (plasmid) [Sinorhizobium meliloti]|uniref:nuclear transport factor 2 family protein n=1 Tax=Rhizobium meliloti TaxID=382 RepID=UPI0002D89A6E|nr:nuclear transport factor 2 family protein [Sinorhizobium meliloti]MDE3831293.1 nuclear transport factor 2 family protein [Sinorhizobium meliloti]MDE3877065.1 nuclear transport factor 2 family protein [Sinorhizobium meliloti]MDE4578974.1 nuclear transport factor 2 family protein [Sinorhizobium meliloti]MDW9414745.1 nuclear transport factor 2 family protein [Sinorhizobium meliloti]MDW9433288.1 nuclear transport factor 2 family protein [Sinorhizobium meliloti]
MIFSLLPDRLAGGVRMLLIASTAMGSIGPAHADTIPPPDIETQNRTTVRAAFEKWRAGGNIFAELLAPDVVWTIHGSAPVAGTYRGVEDFVERASAPLISRLATPLVPRVHHIWADGDTVIVRFDGSATTTSGAPYRNKFVWIFLMKNGAVVEAEAFLDLATYHAVVDNNEPRSQ